jgi:hypothetical protein
MKLRAAIAVCAVTCASFGTLLGSGGARAQGIASNAEEPRAGEEIKGDTKVAVINEVERGFFLSVDYGPNYYIPLANQGFVSMNQDYLSPGTRMGLRFGYDILNNIAADVFVLANFNQGVLSQQALRDGVLTGDLAHFAPGVGLRFDFLTIPDAGGHDRFFAFARVGAGYALWFPSELAGNSIGSVHTDASIGFEYYTHLRHLSIGVEADFQALIAPFAFGFAVYPTVKYTFGDPFRDESDEPGTPATTPDSGDASAGGR